MFFDLTLSKKRVEVFHIKYDDLDTSINISCIKRNNEIACQYMKQAQRTAQKKHSGERRFRQLQSTAINMLRRNEWTNNGRTNKGTTYLKTNFWNEKIKPAVNKYLETDQSNN